MGAERDSSGGGGGAGGDWLVEWEGGKATVRRILASETSHQPKEKF